MSPQRPTIPILLLFLSGLIIILISRPETLSTSSNWLPAHVFVQLGNESTVDNSYVPTSSSRTDQEKTSFSRVIDGFPRENTAKTDVATMSANRALRPQSPDCPEGCQIHGTCNHVTGHCSCPPHLEGPNCSQLAAPACRSHADWPETGICVSESPGLGWNRPVDCECHMQCLEKSLYVNPGQQVVCYDQTKLPTGSRISRIPPSNDTSIAYYNAKFVLDSHEFRPLNRSTLKESLITPQNQIKQQHVPLDECPELCNYKGSCIQSVLTKEVHCVCFAPFQGATCGFERHGCIGNCSGRGTCRGSFCHCHDGYWGMACQLSLESELDRNVQADAFYSKMWPSDVMKKVKALRKSNETVLDNKRNLEEDLDRIISTGVPRIYVYELPAWLNKIGIVEGERFGTVEYHNYDAPYFFLSYLSNDTSVRVTDPEQADLFYVPIFYRMIESNLGDPSAHVQTTLRYIKENYPYWNRRNGRDHVWWFSGDLGACVVPRSVRNSILIAHWGPMKLVANESDPLFIHGKEPREAANNDYECYHPSKDVVAVGFNARIQDFLANVYAFDRESQRWRYVDAPADVCGDHTFKFWFTGTISKGPTRTSYSMGVREKVFSVVANLPGYTMNGEDHPALGMGCSTFCLAPEGFGWGNRDAEAMASGCIPVIVDTQVAKMFWDVLPWDDFAVILPYDEMDHLPNVLDSYSAESISEMRNVMAQYHQAVDWFRGGPNSAYGYTLHSLARRFLTNVILHDLGIVNATITD